MQSTLSHYATLVRRWAWLVVLGLVVCGGVTYVISKRIPPVYQASSILIINLKSSTSPYDNISASQLAASTYAPLLTSAEVLKPILESHPELTMQQLSDMVSTKTQPNTSLIELDVVNNDPVLAAQLANEISHSFASYTITQLFTSSTQTQDVGDVQIVPAETPVNPIKPKPSQYAAIGALVGLGLAIALIIIFEWIDDRLKRPEEVQELLGMETLAVISRLSRKQRSKQAEKIPALAEAYRIMCASLNAIQAVKPFKLVMITSALPGEGKSTIAANLASFLARTRKSVLLVDADLRHPMQDRHFQLENSQGFSDALLEGWTQVEVEMNNQATDISWLSVLTAGVPPTNPTDLLQSPKANHLFDYFKKAPFDYIIFDVPALLPVADARILATHTQATVLVIDASKTSRGELRNAGQVLNTTHTFTAGVVINKSRWPEYDASRYYVSTIGQAKPAISMTIPPNTPPVEDMVDPDLTITFPRGEQIREG